MDELAIGLALSLLSLFIGILLPGIGIATSLTQHLPTLTEPRSRIILALTLGSVWASFQLLITYLLLYHYPALTAHHSLILITKIATDLLITFLGCRTQPKALPQTLGNLSKIFLSKNNLPALLIASLTALYAMLQWPYGTDNAAIFWLAPNIAGPRYDYHAAQGSPAYIAWLYWPTFLAWPALTASTLAASAKLVLHWLAFFALKRLCYLNRFTANTLCPPLLYILTLFSFSGQYGLLSSGKETAFSIYFLLAAMAALTAWSKHSNPSKPAPHHASDALCFLTLGFGFGAITTPYAGIFFALFFLMGLFPGRLGHFAFRFYLLGWPILGFSFATMLHQPLLPTTLFFLALGAIHYRLRHSLNHLGKAITQTIRRTPTWLNLVLFTLSMITCALLLPAHFPEKPYKPLDGETPFLEMFVTRHPSFALPIGWLFLPGVLIATLTTTARNQRSPLLALAAFPFVTLIPCLALVHLGNFALPFSSQHLWDLVKDIPNWIWGPLASWFALITLAAPITLLLKKFNPKTPTRIATALVILTLWGWHLSKTNALHHTFRPHEIASIGPLNSHEIPLFSAFSNAIQQELINTSPAGPRDYPAFVFYDDSAIPFFNPNDLTGLGILSRQFSFTEKPADDTATQLQYALAITTRQAIQNWMPQTTQKHHITEILHGPKTISLFRVIPTTEPNNTLKFTDQKAFPITPPTLAEHLNDTPLVSWTEASDSYIRNLGADEYIWGKLQGTIWLQLPRNNPTDPKIKIKIKYRGGSTAPLKLTSDLFPNPVTLTPETRQKLIPLTFPENPKPGTWHQVNLHYQGPPRLEQGYAYPKNYIIDLLELNGHKLIR